MAFSLHGVHVPHRKNTAKQAAVHMPAPATVTIPMSMHIGAPATPTVKVGDTVTEGQLIANAAEGLSLPQYASIAGRVVFADDKKIVIQA